MTSETRDDLRAARDAAERHGPRDPIVARLRDWEVLILDGGLATELEGRGADLDDPLWSARVLLENPDLIAGVHADYLAAGADVIATATYQATLPGFERHGLDRATAVRVLRDSVAAACAARDRFWSEPTHRVGRPRPLVAASIGPYGAYRADGSEYTGDYDLDRHALAAFHRPRLEILASAGADLLAFETVPSLLEAEVLVSLLAEVPDTPAWLSFSCRDETHTCHGEPFEEAVALADSSARIVAVGVNCTPPRHVEGLLERAARATRTPLLAYPNSGEGWDPEGHRWLPGEPDEVWSPDSWVRAGARLVGGCCRTTPADIRRLRQRLRG